MWGASHQNLLWPLFYDSIQSTCSAEIWPNAAEPICRAASVIPFVFAINVKSTWILLPTDADKKKAEIKGGLNDYGTAHSTHYSALHSAPPIKVKLLLLYQTLLSSGQRKNTFVTELLFSIKSQFAFTGHWFSMHAGFWPCGPPPPTHSAHICGTPLKVLTTH